MSSHAPTLLRRLLDQSGGATERGFLLVIDGEGLEALPATVATAGGSWGVFRVSTELGLRHLLWKAQGAPLIAVLPEAVARKIQKAPDLLRRARNQRVHALSVNDVLEVVLGVRVIGAEEEHLQTLALSHVDKLGQLLGRRTLPTVVDRRLLTELLVDASVGEQVRTRGPAQLLASWVRTPPAFTPEVGKLLADALPSLHGEEGRWLGWALAAAETRLRELVVYGAVLTVEAVELPKPAWGPLAEAFQGPLAPDPRSARRTVTRLVEETLEVLGDAAGPLLEAADKLGRQVLTSEQLATSRVLPLALDSRCFALAQKAAAGRGVSASELAWLNNHRAAPLRRADLAVLEALARLSRYLDQPESPPGSLQEQVRAYLRDGAFGDLAMHLLRRALAGSGQFHAEAAKVLTAYRARRDAQNLAFAKTLAQGYASALHAEGLVPLHRVWKRVVEPWWTASGAGLFLVVLDGCSYPVFLELLFALAADPVEPIGLAPDADGRVQGLPGLAPLPTITSFARGALFLGELPQDPLVAETVFRDQEEARTDKARFQQNAALGGRSRRLFLKGDLADGGVALWAALSDPELAVVGVVFNAVDDQIGSSNTGAPLRITPEDIAGFKPALQAALRAGRRVLLTADHGHSPYFDKSLRVGAGKTPRYLPLAPHEPPPEGFLEIDLAGLGGPPERRAFAWRTGVYQGMPQVGFHGGCSLEEMVVPLAWLQPGGLPADEPPWWFGRGAAPPAPVVVAPVVVPLPPPPVREAPKEADGPARLGLPAELLGQLQEEERAVLVLLQQNGSARATELAERLRKNPGRLVGLMVRLRRTLHAAGHQVFTDELLPTGETLYRFTGERLK